MGNKLTIADSLQVSDPIPVWNDVIRSLFYNYPNKLIPKYNWEQTEYTYVNLHNIRSWEQHLICNHHQGFDGYLQVCTGECKSHYYIYTPYADADGNMIPFDYLDSLGSVFHRDNSYIMLITNAKNIPQEYQDNTIWKIIIIDETYMSLPSPK